MNRVVSSICFILAFVFIGVAVATQAITAGVGVVVFLAVGVVSLVPKPDSPDQ